MGLVSFKSTGTDVKEIISRRAFEKWFLLFSFLIVTGCAHVQNKNQKENQVQVASPSPHTLKDIIEQDAHSEAQNDPKEANWVNNRDLVIQGIKLKNTRFDIPITVNSRVEHWIDYFCGRGRVYFTKYLERSEFFIPYIAPLLQQNGLPQDMVYLAMIESGFNNLARSRARAVGPWQFISATGKRYGLNVNWWVDERRDIHKSTLAAVGYLRDLYSMFQSWELAAAAYNSGEAKIARAIQRFGSRDFWVISQHSFLKPETRDYVPKIIAAALISKNRAQFGFPEGKIVLPGVGVAVAGNGEVVKLEKTDRATEDKSYRSEKAEDLQVVADADEFDDSDEDLGVPSLDQPRILPIAMSSDPVLPLAKSVPTPHLTKSGEVGGEELAEFEVRSPADLLKIARAAGLSYQTVKSLNPEILRWCTPPLSGNYRIKLPAFAQDKFLATYNHEAFPRQVQFMSYKVHRGETLSRIAQHFGIKVDPISDLNRISPRVLLQKGTFVLLPVPNDRSRTFASLEVRDPPEKRRGRRHRRHGRYYKATFRLESLSKKS